MAVFVRAPSGGTPATFDGAPGRSQGSAIRENSTGVADKAGGLTMTRGPDGSRLKSHSCNLEEACCRS